MAMRHRGEVTMHEARSKQQLLATLEAIRDTVRYIEEQDDEPLEPVDVLAILETRMGADWLAAPSTAQHDGCC